MLVNILDYAEHEFHSFEDKSFNPIDSALLSQFCMIRCGGMVPFLEEQRPGRLRKMMRTILPGPSKDVHFGDLLRAERYHDMFTGLVPERIKETLLALAASPRFRTMELRDYKSIFDEQQLNQFAAVTFVHDQEFAYIGFRGTDTSLTGWRENFNMATSFPVPAQTQALEYLEMVTTHLPEKLYLGGHSKGANLALYAALKASPEIQQRIERIYVHDGPGFKQGAIAPEEWLRLEGRIHRSVPKESIVGMLMDCPVPVHIAQAQDHGLNQHSVFTWDVNDEMDDFSYTDELADSAEFFDSVFSEWLSRYSDKEAATIVDALFKAIEASGVTNASELFFSGMKIVPLITKAAQELDSESGAVLRSALGSLAAIAANRAGRNVSQSVQGFFTSKLARTSDEADD